MAQFIYLSLLLATIQLPLVMTIQCHFDGNDVAECDCFSCDHNNKNKDITNLGPDSGTYLCNDSHPQNDQCDKKVANCTKLDLHSDVASPAARSCWSNCTDDSTCKYIKFHMGNKRCFLISSNDSMMARNTTGTASWWFSLRNCNVSINGTTPVNPLTEDAGLTFEEEEKSWIRALEHCYGMKSSLVEITNSTVWNAVMSLLQNKTELQRGVWIGLERSIFGRRCRPWKWISGSEAKDDEPQWNSSLVDPLNNHCGKIIQVENSKELKWLDGDCHEQLPFICQG